MRANYFIETKQKSWALRTGRNLVAGGTKQDDKRYLESVEANLFEPLSPQAEESIGKGKGGELNDTASRRAKMAALHSSSALAVNLFHYWNGRDVYPILRACGLRGFPPGKFQMPEPDKVKFERDPASVGTKIVFEETFPITLDHIPHLDVVVKNFGTKVYAVESKFAEPYSGKSHALDPKYIAEESFWDGLDNLREWAKSGVDKKFGYLDAVQLIKHILGLKKNHAQKSQFHLLYLWYDVYGPEGEAHRREIEEFAKIADKDGIGFSHTTHQEVIARLAREFYVGNEKYIDYMTDRYL